MFAAQLDRSIDNELQGLAAEVLPAVDMTPRGPSLNRWACGPSQGTKKCHLVFKFLTPSVSF